MRKRLKLKTFLIILGLFLFAFVTPLIVNGRIPEATKPVNVAYNEQQFIKEIGQEVQPIAKIYGVRPSIIIGQILLETKNGKTLLSAKYHNLFSLPAQSGTNDVLLKTNKPIGSYPANSSVNFAQYKEWEGSIVDYFQVMSKGTLWDKQLYRSLSTEEGYKAPAQAIQEYQYPYDKTYASRLIKTIEKYDLTHYDK